MEKLYKQFVVLVIKWKNDEVFIARLKLTFFYSLTAFVILVISSFILYRSLMLNVAESINDEVVPVVVIKIILNRTQEVLKNRFIVTDSIIMFFVIIAGFLLTKKTLAPIRESMKNQKRFIADASHELRTPVAVVISGIEIALRNKNLDIDKAKVVLQKSLDEMKEFSNLSNHLLDISKYNKHTQETYENIVIVDLLKSIISKIQPLAEKKNINIKTRLENKVGISCNSIELERVFYNVLSNAITYTPPGGEINISDNVNKNNYSVVITDTGPGISKDIIKRVFDPFFRGDLSRNTSGAGLGLTIAKKIIEDHKGVISIKSEIQKGTMVIISLPIASY